jgi:hypothetical protein
MDFPPRGPESRTRSRHQHRPQNQQA